MKKGKTKVVFPNVTMRDKQLELWESEIYTIDTKNPLIVWLKL